MSGLAASREVRSWRGTGANREDSAAGDAPAVGTQGGGLCIDGGDDFTARRLGLVYRLAAVELHERTS